MTDKELLKSVESFKALAENAPDVIVRFDRNLKHLYVNPSMSRESGIPSEAFIGKTHKEMGMPEEVCKFWEKHLGDVRDSGNSKEIEFEFPSTGGVNYYTARIVPEFNNDKEVISILSIARNITGRKLDEKKLKLNEQILSQINDSVAVFSLDGKLIYWNKAAEKMYGFNEAEVLGKSAEDIFKYKFERGETLEKVNNTILSKGYWKGLNKYQSKSGEEFWVDSSMSLLKDDDGNIAGIISVFRDVSKDQKIETELRKSREELDAILKSVGEGITVQDNMGKVIYANDAAARICGFKNADEFLGAPIEKIMKSFRLMTEDDKDFPLEKLPGRRAIAGETDPMEIIKFKILETGEERYSHVQARPIFSENGLVRLAVNVFHDVTDRKKIENKLRFLSEASSILASTLDYETIIKTVSQLAVPTVADWCGVYLVDENDKIKRVALNHANPERLNLAKEINERYAGDENHNNVILKIIKTGEKVFVNHITDEFIKSVTGSEEHYKDALKVAARSLIGLPLNARQKKLGAIAFVMDDESGRHFETEDISFFEEVAQRIAVAIENAALYNEIKKELLERKKAEERFRLLVEQSPLSIQFFSPDGKVLQVNKAWEDLFGATYDQIIDWYNILEDDQLVERGIMPLIKKAFNGEATWIPAIKYIPPAGRFAGQEVWSRAFIYPVKNEDGSLREVVLIHENITEQRKIEENLHTEYELRKAIENSIPAGIAIAAPDGVQTYVNPAFTGMFGWEASELIGGKPPYVYWPEDELDNITNAFEETLSGATPEDGFELKFKRKTGEKFDVWIKTNSLKDKEGNLKGWLASVTDITERNKAKKQIENSLKEKVVLLKEVHHRVKNNLQVISSLLNLQAQYLKDEATIEIFKESRNRVSSMALIHEKLYKYNNLSKINFSEYAGELISNLFTSYTIDLKKIRLVLQIDEIEVNIDTAITLGLCITELISNVLKHAFPGSRTGEVIVEIKLKESDVLFISVKDNGIGFPKELNFRKTESLGMQLINSLVDQVNGKIDMVSNGGTLFLIEIPDVKVEDEIIN